MIANPRPDWTPHDRAVEEALELVNASGVCAVLRRAKDRERGTGGRPPSPIIEYTLEGVLVALLLLVRHGRTPSIRAVLTCLLGELTPDQRTMLGVTRIVPAALLEQAWDDEYGRFYKWLNRALTPIDSGFDLPGQRVNVAVHERELTERTTDTRLRAAVARRLGAALINDLIAASVQESQPEGYRGDVVADETIIDVAQRNKRDENGEWTRAACYLAAYYNQGKDDETGKAKRGHGVGITAVVRVGAPDTIHKVVPVVTAITVAQPTSGTPRHLDEALTHHRKNGFDARQGGRNAAYPNCVTDMGYTAKKDYARILFRRRYSQISRFPKGHNHVHPLPGPRGEDTGVIQMAGDVYCPIAERMTAAQKSLVIGTEGLDKVKADRHDRILRELHPLLMGRNSRLRQAGPPGRPRNGAPRDKKYRIELVCPAVQGRVRCPLKPDSLVLSDPATTPEVDPDWIAGEKTACSKSSVVVELPDKAFRQFHGTLPASSWEATLLYDSYRSLTERTFSHLKSRHVTPCRSLEWAPKREPYLLLVIAMSFVAMNLQAQESAPNKDLPNPFRRNMSELEGLLGHKPIRVPPRT